MQDLSATNSALTGTGKTVDLEARGPCLLNEPKTDRHKCRWTDRHKKLATLSVRIKTDITQTKTIVLFFLGCQISPIRSSPPFLNWSITTSPRLSTKEPSPAARSRTTQPASTSSSLQMTLSELPERVLKSSNLSYSANRTDVKMIRSTLSPDSLMRRFSMDRPKLLQQNSENFPPDGWKFPSEIFCLLSTATLQQETPELESIRLLQFPTQFSSESTTELLVIFFFNPHSFFGFCSIYLLVFISGIE